MEKQPFILSLRVNNHFGVLTRVSALFARRGFNIDSLTVGETENPDISRMTIVSWGDEYIKDQIVKQLEKLIDVKSVELMETENIVVRELMLVRIELARGAYDPVMAEVMAFGAQVIDLSSHSVSVEITGEPARLDAFVASVRKHGSVEVCRTGAAAITRSSYCQAAEPAGPMYEEVSSYVENVL